MEVELSVVMPCLNESRTIAVCIEKALKTMNTLGIRGEVVVADNGSTDGSQGLAEQAGARVVDVKEKGYGAAYLGGIPQSHGKYIVVGDSDDTYDFTDLECFIQPLREGYDFVIGNRLGGTIEKGAMPWANRYIGNPFLSAFLNLLFKTGISDAHCGMRAFTRESFDKMRLNTTGMEFASEMVIKASMAGLKIKQFPITLHRSKYERTPHLRPLPDGWRHLRFMLMYSPTHLFLTPGSIMLGIGFVVLLLLINGPIQIGGHGYDQHFMIVGSLLAILGFQVITLGLYAKAYAYREHIISDRFIEKFYRKFSLEKGLYLGLAISGVGFGLMLYLLCKFLFVSGEFYELRLAIFSMTLIVVGIQTVFSSFLLSIMNIHSGDR
jgi:glycosyltransferase involved in cell wall biosynthesis